jgi:hypothetical protein
MNVCIMYVEMHVSAVYCKNQAEKQVEYEGKLMNILILKLVVYIYIYTYIYTVSLGV